MTYAKYDRILCHECGWEDNNPDSVPRKCPECGASGWGQWKEKTFHKERRREGQ